MSTGNRLQLTDWHISYTLMQEHTSLTHERQSLFEGHPQIAARLVLNFGVECDLGFESGPVVVGFFKGLVVDVQMLGEQTLDLGIVEVADAHLEKASFLLEEPFAELFIAAVGKAADKVRNVIVLAEFLVVELTLRQKLRLAKLRHTLALLESAFKG